jgi:hypothetical protein
MELSRFRITGEINIFETPLLVLKEIADAHGISYNSNRLSHDNGKYTLLLIETLKQQPPIKISGESPENYPKIARFVNPHCSWQRSKLLEAFNTLLNYMTPSLPLPPPDFLAGSPTPQHPTSLSPCILYRLCRHFNIRTNHYTSLDEMAQEVRTSLISLKEKNKMTPNENQESMKS